MYEAGIKKDLKCVIVVHLFVTIEFPAKVPRTSRVKRKNTAYEFPSRSQVWCVCRQVPTYGST